MNETLNEFRIELKLKDKQLFGFQADVASYEEIKNLVNEIKSNIGDVTILVNNAGIMNGFKRLNELTEPEIRRIFDVNILAQFWLCK